ncbi:MULTISPECIES: hypothetical protein [Lysinibacillus]|nr:MULTISPECIES: hypothetical protein [Lysinibacillus]
MGIFIEDIYGITVHYTAVNGYERAGSPCFYTYELFKKTIDTAMICTV